MKFSEIINSNIDKYRFIIRMGKDNYVFLAREGSGINYFEQEQLEWLDSHKPLHVIYDDFCKFPKIEITYKYNQSFYDMMWG